MHSSSSEVLAHPTAIKQKITVKAPIKRGDDDFILYLETFSNPQIAKSLNRKRAKEDRSLPKKQQKKMASINREKKIKKRNY